MLVCRWFVALWFVALWGVWAAVSAIAEDETDRPARPNILWLTCEDISPTLGCYGDEFAITPTLEALAERGVRYTNAVGVTGVCAVNRSCLITGMYPTSIGTHDMRSRARLPDHIKAFSQHLREAGYYCTNNSKTDYNFPTPKEAWDACSSKAHWKDRSEGQPFFAVFNYTGTHESQYRLPPAAWERRIARLRPDQKHDPGKTPVPPFHPDTPETRRDWANYYDTITALDYWIADRLTEIDDAGLAEDTIVFFFSDHGAGMPGCKKWVWDWGIRVPLLVHFPAQYQAMAPCPSGEVCDRLVSFVDFAPTVLSIAEVEIPQVMQGVPFLGPDAGPERRVAHVIRDRMAERYDCVRVVRTKEYQYHRNYLPHLPWSQFTSYTEQMPTMQVWRRMHEAGQLNAIQDRYFGPKPTEELYDVAADPHMIHNLAGDSQYAGVLRKMRAALRRWQIQSRDLGMLPEYELQRLATGQTQWDLTRTWAPGRLTELILTAEMASWRDPRELDALVERLESSEEPAVRWWAAQGLVMLGEEARPARDALEAALEDSCPIVRIAAAEALCQQGPVDAMLPRLIEGLADPTPQVRLRAMNVLDRLGEAARPAVDAMKAAAMQKAPQPAEYLNRMSEYVPESLGAK